MDYEIKGTHAIVTAGTMGIGRAVVDLLIQQGVRVATCARTEKEIKELENVSQGKVIGLPADLTNANEVTKFCEEAVSRLGQVDSLFYNAPPPPPGSVAEQNLTSWDRGYEGLLKGLFAACEVVLPVMKKKKKGSIVVLSSLAQVEPIDGLAASSVFRSSLAAWVKLMAREYGPFGIRVNALLPGRARTARIEELAAKEGRQLGVSQKEVLKAWEEETPLRRIADPKEIAQAALFLASPAASYITGTTLLVDGGLVKGI